MYYYIRQQSLLMIQSLTFLNISGAMNSKLVMDSISLVAADIPTFVSWYLCQLKLASNEGAYQRVNISPFPS